MPGVSAIATWRAARPSGSGGGRRKAPRWVAQITACSRSSKRRLISGELNDAAASKPRNKATGRCISPGSALVECHADRQGIALIIIRSTPRIGRRLTARANEADLDPRLAQEWSAMEDRPCVADRAAAEGREITAATIHACRQTTTTAPSASFRGAEKLAMYHKALRCYQAAVARRPPTFRAAVRGAYESEPAALGHVGGGQRPTRPDRSATPW